MQSDSRQSHGTKNKKAASQVVFMKRNNPLTPGSDETAEALGAPGTARCQTTPEQPSETGEDRRKSQPVEVEGGRGEGEEGDSDAKVKVSH